MHILLFGKNGQVGWELQRTLGTLGELTALDYPEIDFTDIDAIRQTVRRERPGVIVNAAAYTAVDKAESEPEIATAINAAASGVLAEEALRLGIALIHYSTDYVFDGSKGSPYSEADAPNPLNVYGKSKLAGERVIQETGGSYLILRTSWVYSMRQGGFVTKVLEWARRQPALKIVDDQVGNPTSCRMLAEATAQLLAMAGSDISHWAGERCGVYHLGGDGTASRYQWAAEIIRNDPRREEQVVRELLPARTVDFPTPAQRPLFSALDCSHFTTVFGLRLPPWQKALQLMMQSS
ncbi:MAG: dTDP-4-dehydrorhamnose reductase [Chloroflexota bacterium]|nr:MAG: dTDP-4-dehydrorhamnose reductase [Chloroflexota bacterium]